MFEASTGNLNTDASIHVASASKWVAAALLMTLIDGGLLDLDTPASHYVPYVTGTKAGIILRQMFSYTSDMNSDHAIEAIPSSSLQTFARELGALLSDSEPGTTLSYGGVSMQIGAAIMEDVTGQSFQTLFMNLIAMDISYLKTIMLHAKAVHGVHTPIDEVKLARIALNRRGLIGKSKAHDRRPTPEEPDQLFGSRAQPVYFPLN